MKTKREAPRSALEMGDSWQRLVVHARALQPVHLGEMFADDPGRADRLSRTLNQGDSRLYADFSRQRLSDETVELLCALARERGVEAQREAMFAGAPINHTEQRAVLHTALRASSDAQMMLDGENVVPAVHEVLNRVYDFCERLRSGEWKGHTGKAITDVVNLGIGGSDLGPLMACEALAPFAHERLNVHFVSNVDSSHLVGTLAGLRPETTLFIVASKTFTTIETLTNARSAREWLLAGDAIGGDAGAVAKHFVALSTNAAAVAEFGIDTSNMFGFWDWVGGRYSLWSAIGLPVVAAVGPENFQAMLAGARAMDMHFREAPLENNLPVLMALVGIWNRNLLDSGSLAVIPYDQHLHRLPAYLQQLEMESNGKRVTRDGQVLGEASCPVVWGEPGTNGQHAFFQLLHQGTDIIPVDFIVSANGQRERGPHQPLLLANCLAQSEALAFGRDEKTVRVELEARQMNASAIDALVPHKLFPGNRPSTTLLFNSMTPFALGQLIALYEHKVFVQAAVWGINAFDQWGVELGKALAVNIEPHLTAKTSDHHTLTPATARLVDRINEWRTMS